METILKNTGSERRARRAGIVTALLGFVTFSAFAATPTSVGDAQLAPSAKHEKIGELVGSLRGMGVTLVVAEQNMHFCLDIASHVAVIDKGHIVYRDTIEALKANDEVKRRYLAV